MSGPEAIKHSLLFLLLLPAAWTDSREMRIPNRLIKAAWILRILLFTGEYFWEGRAAVIRGGTHLAGSIFLILVFALVAVLGRKGFGFGDVKLLGAMALYVGMEATLICLFYGLILAAGIILVLLAVGKISRRDKLPLAPFFLAGYVWMLWVSC